MSKKYYAALSKKRREDKKERVQNLEKILLEKDLSDSGKSRILKSIETIKNPKKRRPRHPLQFGQFQAVYQA